MIETVINETAIQEMILGQTSDMFIFSLGVVGSLFVLIWFIFNFHDFIKNL